MNILTARLVWFMGTARGRPLTHPQTHVSGASFAADPLGSPEAAGSCDALGIEGMRLQDKIQETAAWCRRRFAGRGLEPAIRMVLWFCMAWKQQCFQIFN